MDSSIGRMGIEAVGDENRFFGQLTTWQLGCLQFVLARPRGVSVRAQSICVPGPMRRPQHVWLGICLSGSYDIDSGGHLIEAGPASITLFDTARSRTITFAASCDLLWVRIPRALLPAQLTDEDHTGIDGSRGAGYLVQHMFRGIVEQAHEPDLGDTDAVVDSVVRLLAALVPYEQRDCRDGTKHRSVALRRVKQHVEQNLASDSVSPRSVADALGMGPRYINKLFAGERTSLMRWTWSRRLERARLVLQRDEQSSIAELAYSLGFKNQSHFSRAFKARFGYAPHRATQYV